MMLTQPPTVIRIVSVLLISTAVVVSAPGCQPNPLLRKQGIAALENSQLERADNRFAKAVHQDPTDWKSQYYLGLVRLRQNRPIRAQLLLERALTLRPDAPETADILDALAEALYQQGRISHLHTFLRQAAADHPTSRDFLRQARYLNKTGDIDGAKLAYRKATHFAPPGDPTPFVAAADFYESLGDKDEAITALRQAYTASPRNTVLTERLRAYGLVPGPTLRLSPSGTPEQQPEPLRD